MACDLDQAPLFSLIFVHRFCLIINYKELMQQISILYLLLTYKKPHKPPPPETLVWQQFFGSRSARQVCSLGYAWMVSAGLRQVSVVGWLVTG